MPALLLNFRLWLVVGMLLAIGGFAWHYHSLVTKLDASTAIIQQQKVAIETQDNTIRAIKQDIAKQQAINADLAAKFRKAEDTATEIKDKLNKSANGADRNLGKMIDRHPQILERIINQGTADALKCIERATGAVTEKDSQNVNNQCPQLFNNTGTK